MFAPVDAAGAEATFGADAVLLYDDNVTRAQHSEDIRSDRAARIAAYAGQFFAPTGNDTIEVATIVRGDVYRRYSGLNNAVIGAAASVRHKFAVGADAPWSVSPSKARTTNTTTRFATATV